jgi:L-seryl-tRNA(Ser) seleniumtransferase
VWEMIQSAHVAVKERVASTTEEAHSGLRSLPSVGDILSLPEIVAISAGIAETYCTAVVRRAVEAERARLLRDGGTASVTTIVDAACHELRHLTGTRLHPVINATGVILHTNLGRAPVSAAAAEAMHAAASGYVPLEMSIESGERGGRMAEMQSLFRALTGCEAALVVNNNAAATMLVLAAVVAPGRTEVLVSRSEAVEIGGSFRIPDILRQSGATLIDVGTTNRTYLRDYEQAVTEQTAAILKVHTSNFVLSGFVHTTPAAELFPLGERHGIPVIDDLGSGALVDTRRFGLAAEPMMQTSVASGAHLICASGDKLLGGPQAGIILGGKKWVAKCAAHPFARAFRADKATLAGLAETLRHYLRNDYEEHIPVWRMIVAAPDMLHDRCVRWAAELRHSGIESDVRQSSATVGGGSLPGEALDSYALTVSASVARDAGSSLQSFARSLRVGVPGIIPRIEADRLWLDARTVAPDDDDALVAAVRSAWQALRTTDDGHARGDWRSRKTVLGGG